MGSDHDENASNDSKAENVNEEVYRQSVDYVTGGRHQSGASSLYQTQVKVPAAQAASELDNKDVLRLAGKVDPSGEVIEPKYLWLPSRKEVGTKYRNRLDRYMQLDFKRLSLIYYLYTPKVAACVFLACGLLLLTLGILLVLTARNTPVYVKYAEDSGDFVEFDIPHDLEAPVYFYYKIDDFYINHKKVAYESAPTVILKGKCKTFKTFADILDLRCINGKNTLNGRDELCTNYHAVPEFKLPAYPCGPISATLMTDNFEICRVEANLSLEQVMNRTDEMYNSCIHLSQRLDNNNWTFFRFNIKNKIAEEAFLWLDPTNPLFVTWTDMTFDSNFLKPYAISYQDVKAGKYKLYLTNNLWPATHWNAKKGLYITSLGKLGNSAFLFEILILVVAAIYMGTGFLILALMARKRELSHDPWKGIDLVKVDYGVQVESTNKKLARVQPLDVNAVSRLQEPCLCSCR